MIELKKKVISVKSEGVVYEVRAPSNRELKAFVDDKSTDDLAKTIGFLGVLGLPEAISWDLDPTSLAEIVEALTPQKKK